MRLALITTTINVPTVLKLYRALDPATQVKFFIAGDLKTPHDDIFDLCDRLNNAEYIHPDQQQAYKCSSLISWNCIQRRNIATLEALKWGATHIYSVDDDNVPLDRAHFINLDHAFDTFHGPMVNSATGGSPNWFDVGQLLRPPARHRGFPCDIRSARAITPATYAKVGVAAGICLGDPDVDAVTRIANRPDVYSVSELLRVGVVVSHDVNTVFNSQNTAFVRDLAPAMFMWPGVGRYDDIFASLVTQRIGREHGYHVHFGKPFVYQTRNPHNLIADLRAEIDGMEKVERFADFLDSVPLPNRAAPLIQFRYLLDAFEHIPAASELLPPQAIEAGKAWCDDVEQAMTELPL